MKLAITTCGNDLSSTMDPRFGRAPHFLIIDTESLEIKQIDNRQNLQAAQGAGIQSAQTVAAAGVATVITGHCGPKAFRTLQAAGIAVYNTDAPTVEEALRRFTDGELVAADAADVEGHW